MVLGLSIDFPRSLFGVGLAGGWGGFGRGGCRGLSGIIIAPFGCWLFSNQCLLRRITDHQNTQPITLMSPARIWSLVYSSSGYSSRL